MRKINWEIIFAEIFLIGLMCLCGTLLLTSSKIYGYLYEILLNISAVAQYSSLIIWVLLVIFGILRIPISKKGAGFFTGLLVFISLPGILNFDSLDLPRLFNLESLNDLFGTTLSYFEITGLVIGIVTGYLLINFMIIINTFHGNLIKQGATLSEVDLSYSKSRLVLLIIMCIALIITSIIALISGGVELLLLASIPHGNLIIVGLASILSISIYIYWLVSQRKHTS
jgi:hypothetical protein